MRSSPSTGRRTRAVGLWVLLGACVLVPVGIAAGSPLQASRGPVWILGGMAGVVALALLLVQPMLVARSLPGLTGHGGRRWHRLIGSVIVLAVVAHVGGLYLTSPEDITDALLLVAPTPFAVYGVIGLGGAILTAGLVAVRSRLGLRYKFWLVVHNALAMLVVVSSVAHAILIEGAMGPVSKAALAVLVLVATVFALLRVHGTRLLGRMFARG